MIADLKPYPEYKESGLPWLGQVPGHWEVRIAIGYLFPRKSRKTGQREGNRTLVASSSQKRVRSTLPFATEKQAVS